MYRATIGQQNLVIRMATPKKHNPKENIKKKKKTSIGNSTNTKYGRPGSQGGNKKYKKRYKGQGK